LEASELEDDLRQARDLFDEEAARSRGHAEAAKARYALRTSALSDEDIGVLRRKHPFLAEFSDHFIRNTPVGDLMKIQSTAMKAGELEKSKDAEDHLAVNKSALASTFTNVRAYNF
jgi:hypothetical protein